MSRMERLESRLLFAGGVLDATFNGSGLVTTQVDGTSASAHAVAVQSNGDIVVAGDSNSRFTLARYNTNGSLDTTFGTNGTVVNSAVSNGQINALAIQSNGQILAAGIEGGGTLVVVRYNANGTIDTTFGNRGAFVPTFPNAFSFGQATGIAIQPGGQIVVAGQVFGQKSGSRDFVVLRLTSAGALDPTFHGKGFVVTSFAGGDDAGNAMLLQPDGAIVVVGTANVGGRDDFGIARYTPAGTLDGTFGTRGLVTSAFGREARARGVGIQSDGDLVVTGLSTNSAGLTQFTTARYTPTGALDSSFGTNGVVKTGFSANRSVARSLLVESNDSLVAVGSVAGSGFALAGYTSNGAIDSSFGPGGTVVTPIGVNSKAFAATLDSSGNIVAVGQTLPSRAVLNDFAVARYSSPTSSAASLPGGQLALSGTPDINTLLVGDGMANTLDGGSDTTQVDSVDVGTNAIIVP